MSLYFLRHGQSQAQVDGVYAGSDDPSLTELGRQQARDAVPELKDLGITQIACSTNRRAQQTAEILRAALGLEDVILDARLAEYDMGELKGKPFKVLSSDELELVKGAEDIDEFHDRVQTVLDYYGNRDGVMLLVSHSVVGRMIVTILADKPAESFPEIEAYPNAKPILVEYKT